MCHSANWENGFDFAGKRIAVIGNGSSGIQIVPEMQKVASKLVNYARSKTVRERLRLPQAWRPIYTDRSSGFLLHLRRTSRRHREAILPVRPTAPLKYNDSKLDIDTEEEKKRFRDHPEELTAFRKKLAHFQNTFYSAVS